MDWKDKRVNAMNRIITKSGCGTTKYLDEYHSIIHSKSKNKMEYKLERENETDNIPYIRNSFSD